MRTVRSGGHESAAMERGNRADAIGHRSRGAKCDRPAHAVTLRAYLPILGYRRLLIQPPDERLRIGHLRRLAQRLRERHQLLDWGCGAVVRGRRLLDAIE